MNYIAQPGILAQMSARELTAQPIICESRLAEKTDRHPQNGISHVWRADLRRQDMDGCLVATPSFPASLRRNHDQRPTTNMSASELFTTTLQGGTGTPFDDTPSDTKNSHISKIVLYYAGDIRCLEVGCCITLCLSLSDHSVRSPTRAVLCES